MATPHRSPIQPDPLLRRRKSVEKLRPDQLDALREGFGKAKELRDSNGFWHWAGLHGAPDYKCEHSPRGGYDSLFLPWHRAYLHRLELALQTQAPQCTLAWWDWPAYRAAPDGIPPAFADQTVDGNPNPLAGSDLPRLLTEPPEWPAATSRRPATPDRLPSQEKIDEVLALPNFDDFSLQMEIHLHNVVHGWVGGTMNWPSTAAYDPIFWAHHTMVDRIWALWQVKHSSRGPRPGQWRVALAGLDMVVEDVLDTTALGYDYAASTAHRTPGD